MTLTPQDKLNFQQVKNFLIDMDGVLVSGSTLIPGAAEFIERLHERGAKFLLLTNNSRHTPRDLAFNLQKISLPISEHNIFTSALATARFLQSQKPNGTAYVIGESGLDTILVLSGVTRLADVTRFPYVPGHIVQSVANIYP